MAQKKLVTPPAKANASKSKLPAGRGGARPGAGRKTGSGAFGEATVPMRVPVSLAKEMDALLVDFKAQVAAKKEGAEAVAPLSAQSLRAKARALVDMAGSGPAGKPVDVARLLAQRPESCFAWTAGQDMPEFGVKQGDVVIIDRAGKAGDGCVAAFWHAAGVELLSVRVDGQGASARKGGAKKAEHTGSTAAELPVWGVAVGLARRL